MTPRRARTSTSRSSASRSSVPGASAGATPAAAAALADLPTGTVPTTYAIAQLERRDTGLLLLLDGTESSWIDLRDPAHLDFEYQQQMNALLEVLCPAPEPVRALHLGGAGCALARAWEAMRPGSTQTAVEIDERLAALVRQWFDLPRSPRLKIRVDDAAHMVTTARAENWDVVVRDVFAAGQVPPTCATEDFHAHCARLLTPGGLYLANISSRPRERAAADLAAIRTAFKAVIVIADPAVARGKRHGNLVVAARQTPWEGSEWQDMERAVRRLPLPVRCWDPADPALPRV